MHNLVVRTVFGILFVAVVVCCLLFSPILYGAVFLTVMFFALNEFYTISVGGSFPLQRGLALLTGFVFFLAVFMHYMYGIDTRWLSLAFLPLLSIGVSLIFRYDKHRENIDRIPYIYTGLIYVALPVCLSPVVVFRGGKFDGILMLSFFIMIWMSDIGAYCLGSALGQKEGAHKLSPYISPKKSWWGFWGGVAVCILTSIGLYFLGWLPFKLFHCVLLAIITSTAGVCGDLFESVWKRRFGVKDSGRCIPGHGGMLDRFDSSLFAIPMACIYLALTGLL